jgi:DNA-binding transcriptional ArsR family regulator
VTAESTTPSPTALRALAHPVRLRMLGMLRLEGPATASGLAVRLGLNSGATSYHLRQLAEHGFVVDDPDRGNGRERWWRAAHYTTHVPNEDADEATRDAQSAFLQAAAVTYNRQIQQAVEEQSTLDSQWRSASDFSDWSLRLTPDEAHSLIRDLHAVMDRYRWWRHDDEQDAPGGAEQFRVLLQAFPRPGAGTPQDDL